MALIAIGRENLLFHTMLGSNDIERSKRFYNAVLGSLGHGEATLNMAGSGHNRLFYRKEAVRTLSSRSRSMVSPQLSPTAIL